MTPVLEIEKDLVRWSRKRWAACFLLLFAAQVGGLIWASHGRTENLPSKRSFPRVVLGSAAPVAALNQSTAVDPMLFAAADAKGFSGAAWLYPTPWNYHYDGVIERPDYVHFADAAEMLPERSRPMAIHRLEQGPLFQATQSRAAPLHPREPAASRLRIEGDLEGRPLLSSPPLPLQESSDILNSSVVEAGVNRDGTVVSSRLLERSRSKTADQQALNITRQIRFAPESAAAAEIAWGKLIFQWFAVESLGTNAAPR